MTVNVLYFSVVNVGGLEFANGGNLCCRNHIRRMAEDDGIKLHVVIAGTAADEPGICKFLEGLEIPYRFLPLAEEVPKVETAGLAAKRSWLVDQASYLFEASAKLNRHVEDELAEAAQEWGISHCVVDYLPSLLFCQNFLRDYSSTLITLNRESEFYKDLRVRGVVKKFPLMGWVSQTRWNKYEKWAYRNVDKVVALGRPDLPKIKGLRSEPLCVTPYLPRPESGWSFTDTRTAFFVGNIHHYPNRLAMEWICTKLAPQLAALKCEHRIVIVGASQEETPESWHADKIEFAGVSTAEHVRTLLREADLCLCPVENDYGMKFKAAEALSYGTPLLASRQTLLGFPYLTDQPHFDLDNPAKSAATYADLIGNPDQIERLQTTQQELHRTFIASQKNIWSTQILDAA